MNDQTEAPETEETPVVALLDDEGTILINADGMAVVMDDKGNLFLQLLDGDQLIVSEPIELRPGMQFKLQPIALEIVLARKTEATPA